MILASVFGAVLIIVLIIGDWYQFTNLRPFFARYGCGVATRYERIPQRSLKKLQQHFDRNRLLQLPHGMARLFAEEQFIVIRPYYQLFTMRFRTAWPLKGSIQFQVVEKDELQLTFVKRMPWSSAILTGLWCGLVSIGTLVFVISFAIDGGFGSFSGALMGIGVVGLGILVLVFGAILVSLAYRLEDHRLMLVYQELERALGKVSEVDTLESP
ncbi:MAG: hypothetical protein GKS05_11080 [Nitrospirales bacterium]|nr:hypothetical protein [Nitrospirales bacterium]